MFLTNGHWGIIMTDLSQAVVRREGHIEICTASEITFKHRGDKVVLRGPLHAMVRMTRPTGKQKGSEEIVLRGEGETKEVSCMESDKDQYDVAITDMGPVPGQPTIMDLIMDRKHMDVVTSSGFTAYHQNDMIQVRGPGHFHIEYRNKQGGLRHAEDVTLNGPGEFRDFFLKAADEDMLITGSIPGVSAAAAPTAMQQPYPPAMQAPYPQAPVMQAPAASASMVGPPMPAGGFGGRLLDGTLIKTANLPTVYVMQGGVKRALTLESFNRSGYRWDAIWILPNYHLDGIPTGDPLN
jgi:hypothetical protein